jgi:hypothetical protein
MDVKETVSDMALKATPPVAVSGATIAGIEVPALVQLATLIYLTVLISYKCWHWYREYKGYKINKEDREDREDREDDDYEL